MASNTNINSDKSEAQLYEVLLYKKKDIIAIQKKLSIDSDRKKGPIEIRNQSKKGKILKDSFGSQDGFTPKQFHELCDDICNTIIFIKVIVGGYNPITWKSSRTSCWGKTNNSFIFSFTNKNFKDAIISVVINVNHAIYYGTNSGPYFGDDIVVYNSQDLFGTDYYRIRCRNNYYEKKIRDSDDYFSVEDYKVFQIVKS
ncbi:hypothetical protein C1646_775033 [Rhizophagus diaphanus]|nr:hypothetical protein C1646_775033 [Rhizophagus diaphanus] [Rhizophagus sp. MUCL 43196]